MRRVIVTVKRKGETRVQDLELPATVPVGEFLEEMTEVLGWTDAGFSLLAYGPHSPESGEPIAATQTLQEAGVRDGFWLVAVTEPGLVRRYQPPKPVYPSAAARGPVPEQGKPAAGTTAQPASPQAPPSRTGTPAPGGPTVKWVNLMPDGLESPDSSGEDWGEGWTLNEVEDLD